MSRLALGIRVAAAPLAILVGLSPNSGSAADAEVHADMHAQLYDVISPYGEPTLRRRRYTHTLALDVSDLDGDSGYLAPELSFRTRLRLDADLGLYLAETDPEQLDRYVPGAQTAPLDLMYGFLEGRHYWGGVFGFRLGRQYQVDPLGWWSFDGALVRLDAPRVIGLELYGGFEQRGGLPMLATSRFEADGVARGARGDLEQNEWPFFLQQKRLAPAYGASLQTLTLGLARARLSYRKVINRDRVVVAPFPDADGNLRTVADDRTSTERAGAAVSLSAPGIGSADADLVFDLLLGRVSDVSASLDWFATQQTTLGLGYDYYVPTFDGDSIFNWFVPGPSEGAELRASTWLGPRVDLATQAGLRVYHADADALLLDKLLAGQARYRVPELELRLDAEGVWGDTGHRVGGNVSGAREFHEGYYDTHATLSLYDFSNALRPQRDATSFMLVLGGGVSPKVMGVLYSRLGLEWEHGISRLFGHNFRVLMSLQLSEVL